MEPMAEQRKVISMNEWERKLETVKVGKGDINKLVINLLAAEGFVEVVENFQLESGTKSDIDLASVAASMDVKKAIQSGNLLDALEKVNNLDPEILNINPPALFRLRQQLVIEMIRDGKQEEALTFAGEKLAPMILNNQGFQEEFERTLSLLAFEDGTVSPVSDLVSMSQRIKCASEVNEAILLSQTNEKEPKLTNLLKMLLWMDKELEKKVAYPRIKDFSTCTLEDPAAV